MHIEARLEELGLVLPEPARLPPGMITPFAWARVYGDHVYLSGHAALNPDGTLAQPLGRVGTDVWADAAYESARGATLALLASLQRAIGDLDRVAAWLTVSGMVNVAPGFIATTHIINGCSDLLLELFGPEIGQHARTAVGMAQLPGNVPVIVAAEVALYPASEKITPED